MDNMNGQGQELLAKAWPAEMKVALDQYKIKNAEQHKGCAEYEKNQKACRAGIAHIRDQVLLANDLKEQLPPDCEEQENLSEAIKNAMQEVADYDARMAAEKDE